MLSRFECAYSRLYMNNNNVFSSTKNKRNDKMSETITIDDVIYSADKRVLIKYPKDKPEERFYVPDFVEELNVD